MFGAVAETIKRGIVRGSKASDVTRSLFSVRQWIPLSFISVGNC